MKFRLIGEVEVRREFAATEDIIHTEVIEAPETASREALIEESFSGFPEEQEPIWKQGYPLVLPEPEQVGAAIAGEAELREKTLIEAFAYIEAAHKNRFTCESIEYVAGEVMVSLNQQGVRATYSEVWKFLADAGYPTRTP